MGGCGLQGVYCFFVGCFFFNDTATTEIYTLSLHDALPISRPWTSCLMRSYLNWRCQAGCRSEEHTSELQSRGHLVCRLLLEKKKESERSTESRRRGRYSQVSQSRTSRPRVSSAALPERLPCFGCNGPLSNPICFFFNDTATTEIYTLSLHDALPISRLERRARPAGGRARRRRRGRRAGRSEEHTSELQSRGQLVCRLLLEKKKT